MASANPQRRASQGYDERQATDPRYNDPRADRMSNGMRAPQNGVARTSSQRQRVSGEGPYSSPGMGYPDPGPSAGPSGQYRPSYEQQPYPDDSPSISRSSKSFAARAAAVPQQPNITPTRVDSYKNTPTSAPQQHVRHRSEEQPAQIDYARTRQPNSASYAAAGEAFPARQSSTRGNERPRQRRDPQYAGYDEYATERAAPGPPNRSATMSSNVTTQTDWAADRSPLQKLEVKLNDISKEEKRAKVMEAEQRLRERKARDSSRRASQGQSVPIQTTASRRVVSDSTRPSQPRPRAPDGAKVDDLAQRAAVVRRDYANQPGPTREASQRSQAATLATAAGTTSKRASLTTRGQDSADRRRFSDGSRSDERAVRFQNNDDGTPSTAYQAQYQQPQSIQVVRGGSLKNNTKPRPASIQDDAQDLSVAHPAPASEERGAKHAHAQHLKHQLPPQTATGVQTRRQIGFERDLATDGQPEKGHHLSNLVNRHSKKSGPEVDPGDSRRLEEWRTGKTARLTLEDAVAPPVASPKGGKPDQNLAWWEETPTQRRRRTVAEAERTAFDGAQEENSDQASFSPSLYLKCGPLLRYTGLRRESSSVGKPARETWRGSILIVTADDQSVYEPAPTLRLFHQPMDLLPPPPARFDESAHEDLPYEYIDPVGGLPKMTRTGGTVYVKPAEDLDPGKDVSLIEDDDGLYEFTRTANVPTQYGKADEFLGRSPLPSATTPQLRQPAKSGRFKEVKAVRLHAEHGVTFWRFNIEVELGKHQTRVAYRINKGASIGFWVPARGETMNVMFYSCNGFSMSVNPDTFSGPDPLWRDVLNTHQTKPFHVMVGGGDQIYNDAVMKQTNLFQEWLDIRNPHEKHKAEFTLEMQEELELFYLNRYSMWFSQGLFSMANSQIPMVNIWDDHDIIDGYGSYPDSFMSTPVFCGLGNIAFKYYMLFQHQSVAGELEADEPSWVLGSAPGPYISSLSRSVFMSFGERLAFLGIDCRTERTRDEIVSEHTYDLILDRCRRELSRGETRHLLVLLGVPIAYPRLVWLENVLTSRALDPLKALGRMGLFGGLMNKFDGGVEILDDLDDHWTAKNHKHERNWFVEELQALAAEKSVRITILGGDVHLAAIGQFYSNKSLKVAKDRDHRYMPNIISSAIVNTPPPDMVVDILNKRNKIHHLNTDTDEDMIPMFTHDVDGKPRNNKHLLPKRNWCSIGEYFPGSTPPPTPPSTVTPTESEESLPPKPPSALQRTLSLGGRDSKPAKLIRRLSLSQKPTSYLDQSPSPPPDRGSQSLDDIDQPQSQNVSAPLPTRPISHFHRRPTNLSEKAAAKGGGDDGHVDLQCGLDIKLNCEIKQGDPSGVTEAYRLLVPALHYNETFAPFNQRKPSLVRRLTDVSRNMANPRLASGSGSIQRQSEDGSEQINEAATREAFGLPPDPADFGIAPRRPPYEVPSRGPSLLKKKPAPFMPRPRPEAMAPPPTSAPATAAYTQGPPQPPVGNAPPGPAYQFADRRSGMPPAPPVNAAPPGRRSGDALPTRHNATAPLSMQRGAGAANDYDDDEDEEDEEDAELFDERPRHRGKFDIGGASKFFGAGKPGNQPGGPPQGGPDMSWGKDELAVEGPPLAWHDAKEKKGWRKFFPAKAG